MGNFADKKLKKQILKGVYQDNLELQNFELGKTASKRSLFKIDKTISAKWIFAFIAIISAAVWGGGNMINLAGFVASPVADSSKTTDTSDHIVIADFALDIHLQKFNINHPKSPEHIAVTAISPGLASVKRQNYAPTFMLNQATAATQKRSSLLGWYQTAMMSVSDQPALNPFTLRYQQPALIADANQPPEDFMNLVDNTIPLAKLFGLGVHTIVIDPGHGGRDPGTIGPQTGITEKEITLDIARKLKKQLEKNSNFRVLLTRNSDKTMTLRRRVIFAQTNKADLFISIHINSLPKEQHNLVETYFFGTQKDSRVAKLAAKENYYSDYGVGEFSSMIKLLGNTLKTQESRELAHIVQKHLFKNMQKKSPRITNAGIKTAPFVVLLGVEVPAILTEIACVSNNFEEKNLSTPEYRQQVAGYLELGIRKYLEHRAPENQIAQQGEKQHGSYQ